MDLNWIQQEGVNPFERLTGDTTEYLVHYTEFEGDSDEQVESAVHACIDKMSTLLDKNVHDDSMFLLFEWDVAYSTLTIVVTDSAKQKDSSDVVKCSFTAIDSKMRTVEPGDARELKVNDLAENIQFWIKDYLPTCTTFLRYSLVAAFHRESRDKCSLL